MPIGQDTVPAAGTPPRPASERRVVTPWGPGWVSHRATEVTVAPDRPVYQALRSPPMVPGTPPRSGPEPPATALATAPPGPAAPAGVPAITGTPRCRSLIAISRFASGLSATVPCGVNVQTRWPLTVTDKAMARSW